jgi:AcrR family transcriptional regulator
MSPDDRRDAILVAAIPLLRRRGAAVTTRELADAACVAEGTLFRVFPDKAALVRAALERALDPTPVLAQLAGVEEALPVRVAVAKVVAILQQHAVEVAGLLSVSHELAGGHPRPGHGRGPHDEHPVEKVVRAVAAVLQPRRAYLRLDVLVCARMLVGLVLAANRPLTAGAAPTLGPHDLAALFCDGALTRTDSPEDPC